MKTVGGAILIAVVLLALVSCNTLAPQPAKTLVSTQTPLPTKPSLATETPFASPSPVPSETTSHTWEDVPLMPNAIEGHGDSQSYTFIVQELVDNVNIFYQEEMVKFGWNMTSGKGNEEQSVMSFTKDANTIEITVVLQTDGSTSVTLQKQAP